MAVVVGRNSLQNLDEYTLGKELYQNFKYGILRLKHIFYIQNAKYSILYF